MTVEWQGFGSYMAYEDLPSLDWASLEQIASVTFTEPQRARLLNAVNAYLRASAVRQQGPRIKEIRAYAQQLNTSAQRLATVLGNGSVTAQEVLSHVLPEPACDLPSLIHFLRNLSLRAAALGQDLTGKPGRPADDHLHALIRVWLAVYEEAGGTGVVPFWYVHRKKYQGRFLDVMESAFKQLIARISSNLPNARPAIRFTRSGLAQAIEAVLESSRQQRR